MGFASGQATGDFFLGQQQRAAVVTRGFTASHLLGAHLVQLFGGAEAREGMTELHKLLAILLINIAALALTVRTVRAADVRAFAPVDPQPAQGVEDLLFGLAGRTQLVGILDAQDELTAVLAGEAQVEQGDVGGADVRVAGGRRRDAGTNGGHGDSRTER
ncbi:hypothetical protein D3C84_244100 [compost metagenome]